MGRDILLFLVYSLDFSCKCQGMKQFRISIVVALFIGVFSALISGCEHSKSPDAVRFYWGRTGQP